MRRIAGISKGELEALGLVVVEERASIEGFAVVPDPEWEGAITKLRNRLRDRMARASRAGNERRIEHESRTVE